MKYADKVRKLALGLLLGAALATGLTACGSDAGKENPQAETGAVPGGEAEEGGAAEDGVREAEESKAGGNEAQDREESGTGEGEAQEVNENDAGEGAAKDTEESESGTSEAKDTEESESGGNEAQDMGGSKEGSGEEKEGGEMKEEIDTIREKAYESFSSFIDAYYFKSRITEGVGSLIGDNMFFWEPAEMYEIMIDAYEHTGAQRYYDMIFEFFEGFKLEHGEDWAWNEYNDDIAWMTIACTRAYNCTGDQKFLDIAVKHFEIVWDRGWSDDLGGGIWWRTDNNTKNACINCPMAIAACLLGDALGDESYFDKAAQIMDWVAANLYDAGTGNVYDSYNIDGNKNHWASTYNQGTFIGANTLLYLHYGEKEYYTRARKAADYTIDNMYQGGVMNNEDNSTDLVGFKGILARWMYCFAMNCGQEDVMDWLRLNGESAWENRNSDGLTTTALAKKTPDNVKIIPYSASAAVSVLNNCREGDVKTVISGALDLDAFARCGRVILSEREGGGKELETVGEGAYLEFTSVRFAEDCDSIRLNLAADEDCVVELRLDGPEGELLAAFQVPGSDTPKELEAEIERVSGRHRVYLMLPEKGRKLFYGMSR